MNIGASATLGDEFTDMRSKERGGTRVINKRRACQDHGHRIVLNYKVSGDGRQKTCAFIQDAACCLIVFCDLSGFSQGVDVNIVDSQGRSEERRVGKECRARWGTAA